MREMEMITGEKVIELKLLKKSENLVGMMGWSQDKKNGKILKKLNF